MYGFFPIIQAKAVQDMRPGGMGGLPPDSLMKLDGQQGGLNPGLGVDRANSLQTTLSGGANPRMIAALAGMNAGGGGSPTVSSQVTASGLLSCMLRLGWAVNTPRS